jgi:hypothetical protein
MKSFLRQQLPRTLAGALIVVALGAGTAQAAPPALGRAQPAPAAVADTGSAGSGSSSELNMLSLLVLCALGIDHFPECNMQG